MSRMLRRLLLLMVVGASSWAVAQSTVPDTPEPQTYPGTSAPSASKSDKTSRSDPNSPDWKGDAGYEKNSLGERLKDEVTTPPCISVGGGGCVNKPKPKVKNTKSSGSQAKTEQPGPAQKPPRSDDQTRSLNSDGESSSRSNIGDLSPPPNDAANHPESSTGEEPADAGGVADVRKWDPHRAAKDMEVGDYYMKRGNYIAAESRYQEALEFKDNFAEAMFKLAVTEEKLAEEAQAKRKPNGLPNVEEQPSDEAQSYRAEAAKYYRLYLKTLPEGDHAAEAQAALQRLQTGTTAKK